VQPVRLNIYLSPELLRQIANLAGRKRLSRSSRRPSCRSCHRTPPIDAKRPFTRRLDRLTRQIARLERNSGATMEMLALFASFFLTVTPPLPPDAQVAAQAKGQQRYEGFVEALGRRLGKGQSLLDEIAEDVEKKPPQGTHDDGLEQGS
jgi:hypothetical protein